MKILLQYLFIGLLLVSCVQKEHEKTITFKVDMRDVENANEVGVRGNFTNPSWQKTIPITDQDEDGIYTVSLSRVTAAYSITFKFVNNNSDYELRDKENRQIVFKYQPEIIEYSAVFNDAKSFNIERK